MRMIEADNLVMRICTDVWQYGEHTTSEQEHVEGNTCYFINLVGGSQVTISSVEMGSGQGETTYGAHIWWGTKDTHTAKVRDWIWKTVNKK